MPKLRFKKNKKEKKEKRHGKKSDHYEPPKLYEEEEGWLPSASSFKEDENEWRERLFEAMGEDEYGDPFYGNSYQQADPASEMTDEEYRQYIVNGMYNKRHASELEYEKKRKEEKKKKKREQEKLREKRDAEDARLFQEYLKKEHESLSKKAQEEYDLKWLQLEKLEMIKSKDIPWPIIKKKFSADSVRSFMLVGNGDEIRKKVRQEQIRYHPDKFMTKIMSRFEGSEEEKERVLTHMNEISGWLNEIWTSRN